MNCSRCNFHFCWVCMQRYDSHNKWYALCPGSILNFSLCINLLLVIVATIFMPVIYTVGPVFAAFYVTGLAFDKLRKCCSSRSRHRNRNCCSKFWLVIFALVLSLTILLPCCLGVAALASAALLSFGIVLGFYYCLVYITRILYYLIAK